MIEAVIGNGLDQIRFGILDFCLVDAQPFHESILHHIFRIGLAAQQIIGDVVQQRLVECDGLSVVQNLIILIP